VILGFELRVLSLQDGSLLLELLTSLRGEKNKTKLLSEKDKKKK
jgi:hypothetical protein